jgi:hypothetical protein
MKDTQTAPLTFGFVPLDFLDIVWPDVEPLLAGAVRTAADRFTTADVKRGLEDVTLMLWVVADGTTPVAAITTRVIEYPQRRGLALDWIGGRRMKEWLPIVQPAIQRFARDCGCTHLEGYGRKAWGRWLARYGWEPHYIAYKMELTDD